MMFETQNSKLKQITLSFFEIKNLNMDSINEIKIHRIHTDSKKSFDSNEFSCVLSLLILFLFVRYITLN